VQRIWGKKVRKLLGTFWGTQWELEEHNENFVRTLWEQQKSNTQKLPLCSSKGCMLPHLIRWKKVFSLIYVLCHFWPTPMARAWTTMGVYGGRWTSGDTCSLWKLLIELLKSGTTCQATKFDIKVRETDLHKPRQSLRRWNNQITSKSTSKRKYGKLHFKYKSDPGFVKMMVLSPYVDTTTITTTTTTINN
jgi:hypothetical protein